MDKNSAIIKFINSSSARSIFKGAVIFAIFFVFLALVQFSTPDMPDNDGFYHIKMAYLMRTQGLKPEFIWLPLTILNVREFYDHHFLFHVALIPFTFGDLRLGAKWGSVLFSSLAFVSVWWLFYKQRVRYSWLWALGLLAISEAFIYRMSITRAQSLSLGVLTLGLYLLLARKYKWLVFLGFVYVWMYNAFPLLLVVSSLYVLAVGLVEHRFEWRPLFYTGLGIGLGSLINPYFPYNLVFTFQHVLPKLTETTVVRVGNEWYPYTTAQLIENSLLALGIFISGVIALGLTARRISLRTATSLFLAVFFGLMLFQSRRFIEYLPPFALIFAAFAWTDYLDVNDSEEGVRDSVSLWENYSFNIFTTKVRLWLPAIIMIAILLPSIWITYQGSLASIKRSKPYDIYADASAWLMENTAEESRVFQTDWDDFPRLFYYNTHNTYLIGLDPTYMQLYNPDLYDKWVDITKGRVENPSMAIEERFGAQFVLTDLKHKRFLQQADDDPGLIEVFRDDQSIVYKVITK
jgi:hypothetical protein